MNKPLYIIGIDPGFSGAIAIYSILQSDLIAVHDMPLAYVGTGKNAKRLNTYKLHLLLKKYSRVSFAIVEQVWAAPKDGRVSVAKFLKQAGIIEGLLVSNDISFREVTPGVWKPSLGIESPKIEAVKLARRIYPTFESEFCISKDGRSEAALLAHFGVRNLL